VFVAFCVAVIDHYIRHALSLTVFLLSSHRPTYNPKYANRAIVYQDARRRSMISTPSTSTATAAAAPVPTQPYAAVAESPSKKRGRPPSQPRYDVMAPNAAKRPHKEEPSHPGSGVGASSYAPSASYGSSSASVALSAAAPQHIRFIANTNVTLDTTDDAFFRLGAYQPLVSSPYDVPHQYAGSENGFPSIYICPDMSHCVPIVLLKRPERTISTSLTMYIT
jgi:hypothetical protein